MSLTQSNIEGSLDAMSALGGAWRGDWNDFDGRTLRHQLDELARIFRKEVAGEDVRGELASFYALNDICQRCRSWTEYCRCSP